MGGLYDGLFLLVDSETETYFDHITGEALYGPDVDVGLETFPIEVTTVSSALVDDPALRISLSKPPAVARLVARLAGNLYAESTVLPPGFASTMGEADTRLPFDTPGLAVIEGGACRFYPMASVDGVVEEELGGVEIVIEYDPDAFAPMARYVDTGSPMQLLARWYGISYAYPGCSIFGASQ